MVTMFISVNTLALQAFHVLIILFWDMLPVCLHFFYNLHFYFKQNVKETYKIKHQESFQGESFNIDSFPSKSSKGL